MGSSIPIVSGVLPQRCTPADSLGRWLPVEKARPMVVNGDKIPTSRKNYWVPYGCRPTYWEISALEKVAAGGKTTQDSELQCNLDALKNVIFTGVSVTSVLFASMRHHMFDESLETAARNKKRDHELQAAGKATMMIDYDLGNGTLIKFVTQSQLMPATQGKSRRVVEAERHAQIAQYVNEKPSAMILHIGLHEICGALGPSWFTHHIHQPCASRKEIAETYEDYGQALFEHGIQHKTFFRSILGSYGDVDPGRYWRWHGFLNEKRSWVTGDARGSGGNPCNSIAGPFAHASFMEG